MNNPITASEVENAHNLSLYDTCKDAGETIEVDVVPASVSNRIESVMRSALARLGAMPNDLLSIESAENFLNTVSLKNYPVELAELEERFCNKEAQTNAPCAKALDEVFKAVVQSQHPHRPTWEYPIQAAREIIETFKQLQTENKALNYSANWA